MEFNSQLHKFVGKYGMFIATYVSTIVYSCKFNIYPSLLWLGVRIPAIRQHTLVAPLILTIGITYIQHSNCCGKWKEKKGKDGKV